MALTFLLTLIMAIIKKTRAADAGENADGNGTHSWWECKYGSHYGPQYGGSSVN
jgi:hypothetical protein